MTHHVGTPRSRLPRPDLPPVERRAAIPAGFRAGGLAAGIKASGRPDLAVVVDDGAVRPPRPPSSPRTRSRPRPSACRRPTSRRRPADARGGFGWAEAVISTSGSRERGDRRGGRRDQATVAGLLAAATGVDGRARPCTLSTGIIGTRLPVDKVRTGLATLVADARRRPTTASRPPPRRCARPIRSPRSRRRPIELPDADGRPVRSPSAASRRASG